MVNTFELTLPAILTQEKQNRNYLWGFPCCEGQKYLQKHMQPPPLKPANPLLTSAEQTLQLRAAHST